MTHCEICQTPLSDGHCPACSEQERELFRALVAGEFPATAFPPVDLGQAPGLARLKRALLKGDLPEAESLWLALLRTLRPLGSHGREQLAACFQAMACLELAMGKPDEASRFHLRSLSAAKDPSTVLRRHSTEALPTKGWDNHAWLRLQADEAGGPPQETVEKVNQELDQAEASSQRRRRLLATAGGALAGLYAAILTGLPEIGALVLGAGLGWLYGRRV